MLTRFRICNIPMVSSMPRFVPSPNIPGCVSKTTSRNRNRNRVLFLFWCDVRKIARFWQQIFLTDDCSISKLVYGLKALGCLLTYLFPKCYHTLCECLRATRCGHLHC